MSAKVSVPLIGRRSGTPSLRADFSWTLAGNAIYAGGQWITLVILAKLTSPELVGQYALGFAIAVPVFMLASLQLRLAFVADVHETTHFGHYLSLRLISTALGLAVICAITQVFGFRGELQSVILLVGVAQALETISDLFYARLQLHDRMDQIAKSLIARAVLSAIGLTVGVYFGRNLLWGVAGIVLGRAAVLLGYDIRKRTHGLDGHGEEFSAKLLKPRWDLCIQSKLFWLNLPLGVVSILACLTSSVPRYFIERTLGERALGIYSAIAFMRAAGDLAMLSLAQPAFTRLARLYATENLEEFRSLLGKLLMMGAGLGLCGIIVAKIAGHEILGILFRPEYAEKADLLPWIMTVGCLGFMAQFLGYGMTAAKNYNSQIVLFSLVNITVGVGSYLLIPRYGLLGAIFAMLIAVMVQFAGGLLILIVGMRRPAYVCLQNE